LPLVPLVEFLVPFPPCELFPVVALVLLGLVPLVVGVLFVELVVFGFVPFPPVLALVVFGLVPFPPFPDVLLALVALEALDLFELDELLVEFVPGVALVAFLDELDEEFEVDAVVVLFVTLVVA
jgi:hypothetical protein